MIREAWSELVYYFDLENIPASSPTSRAVTAFAEKRHRRRSRHEGPIAARNRILTEEVHGPAAANQNLGWAGA